MNELSSQIDLYDSEVREIGRVMDILNEHVGTRMSVEAFRREAIDRFASIGLKLNVLAYTTTENGTYAFDFEIVDRTQQVEFDYDRQVHEVTNDLLDLGEGGVIKSGPQLKLLK